MNSKKNLISLLLICSFVFTSCKKEGCTDDKAENYQVFASKDNGSCVYRGSVVFWYRLTVFSGLSNAGISSLSLFINDELKMQHPAGFFSPSEPICGTTNTMSLELDLGNTNTKVFDFEIKDQNGNIIWSGVINASAKQCSSYELTF